MKPARMITPGLEYTSGKNKLWLDRFAAAVCLLVGGAFAYALSQRLSGELYGGGGNNVWFQADLQRTLSNMVDVGGEHYRTKVHPIASLVLVSLTGLIRTILPVSAMTSALLLEAIAAGLWAMALYILCRRMGCGYLAAFSFTGLGVSSAAFMFWFSVAETYGPGSLTILAVILMASGTRRGPVSDRSIFVSNVISLSMTVTNWMAGLAYAFLSTSWRRAARIALAALIFTALLAIVQKTLIPSSKLFFFGSREELMYVNRQESGSLSNKLTAMLLHGFAMPHVQVKPAGKGALPLLSVQLSKPGSGSSWGAAAVFFWVLLLAAGAWGAFRARKEMLVIRVVTAFLAGQVVLHALYGEETFLYALNFAPALIALAVLGRFSPMGVLVPWIAAAATVLGLVNNLEVFSMVSGDILMPVGRGSY